MRYPRSVYVSADDVFKDPDAQYEEDVQWQAERFCLPINLVETMYGLQPGTLYGHVQSYENEGNAKGAKLAKKQDGTSFDLIEGYRIWSKNGFGNLLSGEHRSDGSMSFNPKTAYDVSRFGRYCHIVVAKGVPFPLNLPPELLADEEAAFMAAQWPCPFWQEVNAPLAWPLAELRLYEKPKTVWPVSLFKSVYGEMKFINWCMSFLADKAASSCQSLVVVPKQAGAEMQKQLNGANAPFSVLEISSLTGLKPQEVVAFIQSPQFPADIWTVIAAVDAAIDKRLGLTELMYGMSSRQMRSAAEADLKGAQVSLRPEDMANNVEDWVTLTTVKEAEVARYHLSGADVASVLGPLGAAAWDQHVQNTDPDVVVNQLAFRIEAGSTRKPNKQGRAAQLQEFAQVALPVMQQFAAQGMVGPYNAFMAEMAKSLEIDPQAFIIQLPPPQTPAPDPAQEAAAAQTEQEMQVEQVRLQMDQQRHVQEMTQDQERHDQDMKLSAQKAKAQAAAARQATAKRA